MIHHTFHGSSIYHDLSPYMQSWTNIGHTKRQLGCCPYQNTFAIFSISSAFVSGNTWLYRSIVMASELCPRIVFNTCGCIPASIALVANVCRNTWAVMCGNSWPAAVIRFVIWSISRCILARLNGSPFSLQNKYRSNRST